MTTWDGLAERNQQLQRQLREAQAERDALAVKVADAWDEGRCAGVSCHCQPTPTARRPPMPESTVPLVTAEQARALLEAATPAPWINALQEVVAITTGLSICDVYPVVHDGRSHQPDADLIAAAPDLAATVVALHARLADAERKLALPCGSCHPCTQWANQTWINAGEMLPAVITWQDMKAKNADLTTRLEAAEAREGRVRALAEQSLGIKETYELASDVLTALDGEGNQ